MRRLWACNIFNQPKIYYMHFNTWPQWKRWNSSYTGPPVVPDVLWVSGAYRTCSTVFAIKNFLKRLVLAHFKFSLWSAREYSKWFSTFLSSSSKGVYVKGRSESDPLAGLNPQREASRDTAEKGLHPEENANRGTNYVPKGNYRMSPKAWSSSTETAETVHKRYQKDSEETVALKGVSTMPSTACTPAWLVCQQNKTVQHPRPTQLGCSEIIL